MLQDTESPGLQVESSIVAHDQSEAKNKGIRNKRSIALGKGIYHTEVLMRKEGLA